MLDKSLEYIEILMKRRKGKPVKAIPLPEGFKFTFFEEGNESDWADIESSVGEFDSKEKALEYFKGKYLQNIEELKQRCIFVENPEGEKIATFTAWWEILNKKRKPWVSWVAVNPGYQARGLGKAIVSRGMNLFLQLEGDVDIYLKTQTWSYKAVNIYRTQGFRMQNLKKENSWGPINKRKARKVMKGYIRK
jgi:GNAT superfamily N-acetyltransferase